MAKKPNPTAVRAADPARDLATNLWRVYGGAAADTLGGPADLLYPPINTVLRKLGAKYQLPVGTISDMVPEPVDPLNKATRFAAGFLAPGAPATKGAKAAKEVKAVAKEIGPLVEKYGAKETLAHNLPPAENAQRTQISGTTPTYTKAKALLDKYQPEGKTIDFGAGLGEGAKVLGADTYEPFPRTGFEPTYRTPSDIPDETYHRLTNLNVLNVVPKATRDTIVKDIGRVLAPGGRAVITTRGRDVLTAAGETGPEAMSKITTRGTYQKGFTPEELHNYVRDTLGDGYDVERVKLGPAGVVVTKRAPTYVEVPSAPAELIEKYISDWKWRPQEEVGAELGLGEVPEHVADYGRFMDQQASRAATGKMSPRDLIKAYGITRSSMQRSALKLPTAQKRGLSLEHLGLDEVRPEGAFSELLGTPEGQAYLDAAQRGQVRPDAISAMMQKFAPYGFQNALGQDLEWAASNLPQHGSEVADMVAGAREGASNPEDWVNFIKENVRGVDAAKSGFVGAMLGRGDLPTLDARQIILQTGEPTRLASKYLNRGGGKGAIEALRRLTARMEQLGMKLPTELEPYRQHLTHHAVWDKAAGETTTHSDVMNALKNYAEGGSVEGRIKDSPVLKTYKPSLRERAQIAAEQAFTRAVGREPGYEARDKIEKLTGLLDFVPVVGDALGVDETKRALDSHRYVEAGLTGLGTALGAVPVVGDVAGKVVRGAAKPTEKAAVKLIEKYGVPVRSVRPAEVALDPRIENRKGELPKIQNLKLGVAPRATSPAPEVSIFDFEGHPYITSMSDLAAAGDDLVSVNDVLLRTPFSRRGGQDYMFDNPGSVWASERKPAEQHVELARRLQNATGKDVLYLPWTMGPNAVRFSHHPRGIQYAFADATMDAADRKALAGDIKKILPGWREFGDPASDEMFMQAAGKSREVLNLLLDKYRTRGGLGIGEATYAATDLGQLGAPLTSLRNVGVIDPRVAAFPSTHPSYNYSVPGRGIGVLKEKNLGALALSPDVMRDLGYVTPFDFPVGVQPGVKSPLRTMQMKPQGGVLDYDTLRFIEQLLADTK